jgi:hypothetical protein
VSGSCTFTPTVVGARTITATYGGDDAHEPSSDSKPHVFTAIPTQVVSLTSSANPATIKENVTFEARIVAPVGTPAGIVSFGIGACGGPAQLLGQASLNGDGIARLTRKLESPGSFCIIATYQGSGTHAPSQSPPPGLSQLVVLRR